MPWSRVSTFTDPVPFQAALQSTVHAEILPVARGSFHIEATQVGMDKLRMQRFKVALPQLNIVETSPDRKSIGFLLEASSPRLQHCGLRVTPNDILIYGDGVLHQRSEANFQYGTMSVLPAQDFLVLCATITGREFLEDRPLLSRLSHIIRGDTFQDIAEAGGADCDLPQSPIVPSRDRNFGAGELGVIASSQCAEICFHKMNGKAPGECSDHLCAGIVRPDTARRANRLVAA